MIDQELIKINSFYKFKTNSNWAKRAQASYNNQPVICLSMAPNVGANGTKYFKFMFTDGHTICCDSGDISELTSSEKEIVTIDFKHSQEYARDPFYFRKLEV